MRDGLWPTTLWVHYVEGLPGGLAAFADRLAAIPGDKGVLIKAGDGRYGWDQWNAETVAAFRERGIGVGLWTFCYGGGEARNVYGVGVVERPSVAAEMATLRAALGRATPDAVVLNVEEQVMTAPNPAEAVRDLVAGAKGLCAGIAPVGLSTVWHWQESMAWPFGAALAGGLDFWSNQVYSRRWPSYQRYRYFLSNYGGGKPDWVSLTCSDYAVAGAMDDDARWAAEQGSPGVAWWRADDLTDDRWRGVELAAQHFQMDSVTLNGHLIGGGFYHFWSRNGGVPIFGLPITDEFEEEGRTVQYFERARFEYHPDASPGWSVQLGLVGSELLAAYRP